MGLAIARRLAADGDAVALLDRSGDAAKHAADEIVADGATAVAVEADVSDRAAVDDALAQVRAELGPVAIMVTSAGIDAFERFTEISLESWERMLAVNLTGTFHCLQAVVPEMIEAGWGRIVTISSSSAQSGPKTTQMAHYIASKGGVIALTKALGVELAPYGITVNTIPPAFINTEMSRRAEQRGDLASFETLAKHVPVRRPGTPEDIAAACSFLCSDEASYITGQQINLNGGMYV
jgi:NAD(P)-dependent dehydrogenase (short-subunit alcohol dehydrogenase family)